MRRMLRTALGAALVAMIARPTNAEDPADSFPYPSSQAAPGRPSSQGGLPGSAGANPPGKGMPGGSTGGMNPDGTPIDSQGNPALSGALPGSTGGEGTAGDGTAGGGFASALGGSAGGSGAPPGIIGDLQPISQARVVTAAASTRFPVLPNPIPAPVVKGGNPGIVSPNGTTSILYKLTGLKISDNQSPIPQDRFFYSFNYFDNLNASVDKHIMSPVSNLQVYHQLFGIEKTFLDGRASIGFRVPLNTISLNSSANIAGLGGSSTSPGDLSIFLKYILIQKGNNLISGGLQVSAPTGPGSFGGNKYYSYFRDTQIQPFVGYLFRKDRFYVQGFSSVNVPTTSQDVTLFFNDLGIGYYAYRAENAKNFLTAIVPTAEVHVTTPLNHRGFSATDLASTPDFVNMTFGTNVEFKRRAVLTAAYVTPVTGPKPFNAELVLLLNIRFGNAGRNRSSLVPPPTQ